MEEGQEALAIQPGHGLDFMSLGGSLQSILTVLKSSPTYEAIEVIYTQTDPTTTPIIINLPTNGLRLRFDGPDQRLRLIEVMNFGRCCLAYKGSELIKQKEDAYTISGPAFRRVYQVFGAAFPGEYTNPVQGSYSGTYVLSWPGVAFSFPLQHAAWSTSKDHVSLLGSQAAGPATHMAIFEGASWTEVRDGLFTRIPSKPRSLAMAARPKEPFPAEVELAMLGTDGTIELTRRSPAQPFIMRINGTTPQDLITELGPPDARHKRDIKALTSEQTLHKRNGSLSKSNGCHTGSQPSSYSSTATDTYDTDFDHEDTDYDPLDRAVRETFWCYFGHGMDILVGPPSSVTTTGDIPRNGTLHTNPDLVVTKIVLHGNIPGSYAFNRHRRLRWVLGDELTSELDFETSLKPSLLAMFANVCSEAEMARGKVVNRTWTGSPTDSTFFLPDADQDLLEGGSSEQWLGNTKLYHFPRFAFEVMENGVVSAVTVS